MGLFSWFNRKAEAKSNLPTIDVRRRFELLNRTGQGSMSKVWRARDKSLGRTVCLKLLDKEKTAKFEAALSSASTSRGKAPSARRCGTRTSSQTYEYGMTTEGEPYLVMELVDGMGLNFLVETQKPAAGRQAHQLS